MTQKTHLNMKTPLLFILIYLCCFSSTNAQFFHYEILEGKEFFESGRVHCKIEYDHEAKKTKIQFALRIPRNTPMPTEIAKSNNLYIATQLKLKQNGKLLLQDAHSRYTSIRHHVYQANLDFNCNAYKDPFTVEATAKLSTFANKIGYGNPLFKIKLQVTPIYFDSYDANDLNDPSLKETYNVETHTATTYYPRISSSLKISVARQGKFLKKPSGYVEKDFKLKTTYKYLGKVISESSTEGSSLLTPFFHKEDNENYYIKLIDKGLTIKDNNTFKTGTTKISVTIKLYKQQKVVHSETKLITVNIPEFSSFTFNISSFKLLPDGEKMFKNNSKWNNSGRDPLPDLIAKVMIDGIELARTAEASNSFSSSKGCKVTVNYIKGKTIPILFTMLDKDAFLNPNDKLLTIKKDLSTFMANKPTSISDNYIGSFSLSY